MKLYIYAIPLLLLSACNDDTNIQAPTQSSTSQKVATPKTSLAQQAPKKVVTLSGSELYMQKCASCHGKYGEKVALATSQVIAAWPTQKSVDALNGYKEGSYGAKLKGIMKAQVNSLDDAQIQAVSEYISTLR